MASFCYCATLRTGVFLIAVFNLVVSGAAMVLWMNKQPLPGAEVKGGLELSVVLAGLNFLFGILLLTAVMKGYRVLLVVWTVYSLPVLLHSIYNCVYEFSFMEQVEGANIGEQFVDMEKAKLAGLVSNVLLQVYFIWIVFAYSKQVNNGTVTITAIVVHGLTRKGNEDTQVGNASDKALLVNNDFNEKI